MKRYVTIATVAAVMTFVGTAAGAQGTSTGTSTQTPATGTPSGSQSGSGTQSRGGGAQQGTTADRQFVQKMLMTNMAEIQLGQLGQQKGSSSEVKSFAQQMVTDHTKANQELQPIAQRMGVQAPTQLDAKHKATADKLSKLQGAEFDREYMAAMVEGHREALQDAQRAAGGGRSTTSNTASGSSAVGTSGTSASGAGSARPAGSGAENQGSGTNVSPGSGSGAAPQTATEYAAKTAPVIQQHLEHAQSLQRSTK
jgi:putative membrane protein